MSGLTTWALVLLGVGMVVLPTFGIGHIPNTVTVNGHVYSINYLSYWTAFWSVLIGLAASLLGGIIGGTLPRQVDEPYLDLQRVPTTTTAPVTATGTVPVVPRSYRWRRRRPRGRGPRHHPVGGLPGPELNLLPLVTGRPAHPGPAGRVRAWAASVSRPPAPWPGHGPWGTGPGPGAPPGGALRTGQCRCGPRRRPRPGRPPVRGGLVGEGGDGPL